MQINGTLIGLLKKCILQTHREVGFLQLAGQHEAELMVSYDRQTPANSGFDVRVFDYLRLLNMEGTVTKFVEVYNGDLNPGQRAFPAVAEFFARYHASYTCTAGEWALAESPFFCSIIKDALPFVSREGIRRRLYKMAARQPKGLMVVTGESESGLSYIGWYASHIAEQIGCFQFVDIDFQSIDIAVEGQVDDVDVANHIASSLGMLNNGEDLFDKKTFKIRAFLTRLATYLTNNKSSRCMFFFHQFNKTISENAAALIVGIVKMVLLDNRECFILLSGYPKLGDWNGTLYNYMIQCREDIGNGAFTAAHLEDFYKGVYRFLSSGTAKPDFSELQFLDSTKGLIDPELLTPGRANVSSISKILSDWLSKLLNG